MTSRFTAVSMMFIEFRMGEMGAGSKYTMKK